MPLAIEERVDTLEAVLGEFIVSTNRALIRMERGNAELRKEMLVFKSEMLTFKDEMKDFKDEMLVFKSEMLTFKDEMLTFKDEMKDFKDEMLTFKDEMKDFKDEMLVFKDEMKDFKDEGLEFRKKMFKQWGDLANKMGTIVEDMVAPNVSGIARELFKIENLGFFAVRVRKINEKDRSFQREFDVIAESENDFIVVDVKSNPRQAYIDTFLDVLKELADYFPGSTTKRLIPMFASLYIPENVISYLTKNGIYAMGIKDDTMGILNFDDVFGSTS